MRTAQLILMAGALTVAGVAAAEVYRTVDENGNVVFTDQPPGPGAEPIKMRELSVVPVRKSLPKSTTTNEDGSIEESPVADLESLRRSYRDFRIVQPLQEQTFTGTANIATMAWDTQYALREGMHVVFYINGEPMSPTASRVVASERLNRGEHEVRAELLDGRGRTVASAQPVTFFMRQASVNFNRPQTTPRGGG